MPHAIQSHLHTHDHYTESGEHLISKEATFADVGSWLKRGWMDIAHAPLASLFYGLVMTLFVMTVYLFFQENPILMFTVATSFVMIAPFLATGLYSVAHQLEKGESPDLIHSLTAWRHNVTEFALFAVALGIIIAIWSRITPLIAGIVKAQSLLIVDPDMGVMGFLTSDAGMQFMIAFMIIGAAVAAFVFAVSVVTIPLLLRDQNIGVISSMIISWKVVMENKAVMALWALTIGVLLAVGLLTLGLAMVVVMPLLGYASWHAFTDLVQIEDPVNQ
ncbi:DUF2189 domain-containing protein [Thiomicrorhabdus sp. zzn3]|uniref:DUF2189 domain-containing protein n=1 Tax=Thiomicrorhabdus sp. zzn3 TaxID=3039775 RepID=UPI0024366677|nr:DUF2189 domain-containing protein [Thiomicrorhabdus sp. zzn3]MDG6778774.1 DUF2189 domain-containing protein [Thiomicrorhabdus sp. zzn3]